MFASETLVAALVDRLTCLQRVEYERIAVLQFAQ